MANVKIIKCLRCGKLTKNKKYCSNRCSNIMQHVNNPNHNKAIHAKMKKQKKGFYNSETQKLLANKSISIQRKNQTGFFDIEGSRKGGRHSVEVQRKSKQGLFPMSTEARSKACQRAGRIGGITSIHKQRLNFRKLEFKGQIYDSKPEIEISLCLQEQLSYKPKDDKTLHVRIGRYEYDYFIKELNLFLEYHPWDARMSLSDYYIKRRKNLDINDCSDSALQVIP